MSSRYAKYILSNLANTASLLWHAYKSLPSPSSEVNWAGPSALSVLPSNTSSPYLGFYTICPTSTKTLILGPFQGKVACQTISILPARGVCGAAASTATTQLVADVEQFPGHIACDGDSRSEIVVPVVVREVVKAIIDVDCKVVGGFDEVDRRWLEKLAVLLGGACDWP